MTAQRRAAADWTACRAMLCLLLAAGGAWAGSKAAPLAALANTGGVSGQTVAVPLSLSTAGAASLPSTLVFTAAWDAGWVTFSGVSAGPLLAGAGKAFDFEPHGNSATVVVYGGQAALPQGELVYMEFQVDPAAMEGTVAAIRAAGASASDASGNALALSLGDGSLTVTTGPAPHSADYDGDFRISLSELLRMVQFYNIGSFHCDQTTEDGYAPGPGGQTCTPHDGDYSPRNWAISLNELLRMIQFYNAPGSAYHVEPGSEDGFAPGAWVPY